MARPVGNLPAVTPEVLKLVDEEMKKKQSTASPVGELSLAVQEKEDEEFWVVRPERVSSSNQLLRTICLFIDLLPCESGTNYLNHNSKNTRIN